MEISIRFTVTTKSHGYYGHSENERTLFNFVFKIWNGE